jgi:hypothetical protein
MLGASEPVYDPLYIRARQVLLDALEALQAHRNAVLRHSGSIWGTDGRPGYGADRGPGHDCCFVCRSSRRPTGRVAVLTTIVALI